MYERRQVGLIVKRMGERDNPLLQVVVGPRQTGKSTMLSQALRIWGRAVSFRERR